MSYNSKSQKNKTPTTNHVNCTLGEFGDTTIKINVINSKKQKNIITHNQTIISSSRLKYQQTLSSNKSDKKLMTIPIFTRRELTRNVSSFQLQSKNDDNLKNKLKVSAVNGQDLDQSIVDIQINDLLTNSQISYQSKQEDSFINIINQQNNSLGKQTWVNSQPNLCSKRQHKFQYHEDTSNSNDKFNNNTERNDSKKQNDANLQTSYMLESEIEEIYIADKKTTMFSIKNNKSSQATLKKQTGDKGMKLKDYLYMIRTSTKKANVERRDHINQKKIYSQQRQDSESTQKNSKNKEIQNSEKLISQVSSKQTYVNSKYKINNNQMFQILKHEIIEDSTDIQKYLSEINTELQKFQLYSEPSNEELLSLYNLRRELKDQLMMRTLSALHSIRRDKQANLLKSRRCNERQIEDIDCSKFFFENI